MKLHRLLTVLFIAAIVIHVFQVGISLPRALLSPLGGAGGGLFSIYSLNISDYRHNSRRF